MSKRVFSLVSQIKQNAGGGIMDVPHPALLRYMEPKQMISDFEKAWGTKPASVVLPVTCPDGLLFRVEGLSDALSSYAIDMAHNLRDFQDVVSAFATLGLDIYLLLDPGLPFVDTPALHLVDIIGDGSAQVCFGNPRAQEVSGAILGTGIDLATETTKTTPGKLKGVVLDLVDLWPMGGKEDRLELTCFCPACEKYIENRKPGLIRRFKTFPNPWNLLLRATSSGIQHSSEVRLKASAEDIVGLSRQKGFAQVFEDKSMPFLLEQAEVLLDYIQVRHEQTIAAIGEVFSHAVRGLDSIPHRVILTAGSYYDWTSGLQFERLDQRGGENECPYDEVWFDPSSSELTLSSIPFRSYMWRRARYFLDAFFQFAANAANPDKRTSTGIARLTINQVRRTLKQRLNQALAGATRGHTSLASLPPIKSESNVSQRVGFVGIALVREAGEKFVEGIDIPSGLADMDIGESGGATLAELMKMLGKGQGALGVQPGPDDV